MSGFDLAKKERLFWRKPKMFRREYELLLDGKPLAWLRQRGWFPVQADVFEHPEAEPVLCVTRRGLWRQTVHVKTLDMRLPHAYPAALSWRGELTLLLDNGRSYRFRPANFWHTHWELRDETGRLCLTFRRNGWGFGGEVWLEDLSLPPDELRFLIYVAWNVVIMKMDDQAAAAAG